MIQPERIRALNKKDVRKGRYVLYWMQQAQRAEWNHALEHAVRRANEIGLPLLAVFAITQRFPGANERHYAFMLGGLRETQRSLRRRGVRLLVRLAPPLDAVQVLAADAALVVTDCGYLRVQRRWRRKLAQRIACRFEQVETDVVVPVETVSAKEEYAARTIRPKIHERLERFLTPVEQTALERDCLDLPADSVALADVPALLQSMRINRDAAPAGAFRPGAAEAKRLLDQFVSEKLASYDERRNDPNCDFTSHMSPYLHFGQISPLYVALRVRQAKGAGQANIDAYLEELIVRRELSMNFCRYNRRYEEFDCLPEWAQETLRDHADDEREHSYAPAQLEAAETHDPYWNAAQREMVLRGKMHSYMRMYWGKKLLEWVPDPRRAHWLALELNDRYELDGRDPNGFAGVAWCFGKHDQAWGERRVFGKVRYMSAGGLERKFDIHAYVRQIEELENEHGGR